MAYVFARVDELEGTPLVGDHHCVALVQHYAKAPQTSTWIQGEPITGAPFIEKGTVIATFVDGKYPNKKSGNHAALYMSHDGVGIKVMDQWKGDPSKACVSSRTIRFKNSKNGQLIEPLSNNAFAYYIVK